MTPLNSSLGGAVIPLPRAQIEAGSRPVSSSSGCGSAASSISLHEAAHACVARWLDTPIKSVTILPSEYFAGRVLGPEANPNTSPAAQIAATKARCAEAASFIGPGEDPQNAAAWIVEARSRVIELLAGAEGECIAGFAPNARACETDFQLAEIYSASICAATAVPAFLLYCKAEASAILEACWPAVLEVAGALETAKTLTGIEIDQKIAEGIARAEQKRRIDMAAAARRAAEFLEGKAL